MVVEIRFRRPAEHEQLLLALTGKDGPFRSNYEALLFSAALGKRKGQRRAFEKSGEQIRYALVENRPYGDVLIDLLATTEKPGDAKILADERLGERLRIFEEYANGGLHYLQGEVNSRGSRDLVAIVSSLVLDALTPAPVVDDNPVKDMLDALEW
ncbi:DNA phosphorothioation-associated protein 4 [Kitasatospora sp. NPDC087271]|uniref:DNA phosphorothioation-associated protein 4 n=1 Tax=Kitasatospora sp. NPDC087271 TaxID=3364067 RepID=UPI0037FE5110